MSISIDKYSWQVDNSRKIRMDAIIICAFKLCPSSHTAIFTVIYSSEINSCIMSIYFGLRGGTNNKERIYDKKLLLPPLT